MATALFLKSGSPVPRIRSIPPTGLSHCVAVPIPVPPTSSRSAGTVPVDLLAQATRGRLPGQCRGGKPINSVHAAYNITSKLHCSTVSAHTHLLSHYSTVVGGEGRRIQSLVCGWFGDESNPHVSAYCGLGSRNWWNGVCILHGAEA